MMLSQPSSSSSSSCRPLLSPIYFVCSVRLGGGGGGGWGGRAGEGAALCLASAAADNIQPWNVTSEPQMTLTLERRENTLEVRSAHSHSHNHIVLETVLFFFTSSLSCSPSPPLLYLFSLFSALFSRAPSLSMKSTRKGQPPRMAGFGQETKS